MKKPKCARCPIGQEKVATQRVEFAFGETRWAIDLCGKHAFDIERDIAGWGRLGEEIGSIPASTSRFDSVEDLRRLAELRTKQAEADRAGVKLRRWALEDDNGPMPERVPPEREPDRLGHQMTIPEKEPKR